MRTRKGFTLIEVMVVFVIISILAAVTVPLMRDYTRRLIVQEAVSTLRRILAAEERHHSQHGVFTQYYYDLGFDVIAIPRPAGGGSSVTSDLDGVYFSEEAYWTADACPLFGTDFNSITGVISISCWPEKSVSPYAPKADQVKGWPTTGGLPRITINQTGAISTNIKRIGY